MAEITNIYPPELKIKRTTESASHVSFLDIGIDIVEHKLHTNIYDKRESLYCELSIYV